MPLLPSKRLYLRNLPRHVSEGDLLKHLSSYGKIVEVKLVHDYAFVQFESQTHAEDVLETFQRQPFLGRNIVVEFARPLRKDLLAIRNKERIHADSERRSRMSFASYPDRRYPVVVTNIPSRVCWQQLKDFGRLSGGAVAYCYLDRRRKGRGFLEYYSRDEAERATRELDGRDLGGERVRVCGGPEVLRHDRSRSPERRGYAPRQRSPESSRVCSMAASPRRNSDDYHRHHRSPPPTYRAQPPVSHRFSQPVSPFHAAHPSYEDAKTAPQSCYPGALYTSGLLAEQQYKDEHCHAWRLHDDTSPYDTYDQGTVHHCGRQQQESKMRNLDSFY